MNDRKSRAISRHPRTTFIADSRRYPDEYTGAIRKINVHEAAKLCGKDAAPLDPAELEKLARMLYDRWKRAVFITRGEDGCVIVDEKGFKEVEELKE